MSVLRERREHGVELLRIDRPSKRNALDSATLRHLVSALTELSEDPALRVLVLSTTSVDAFCAGADVTEPLDAESGVARMEVFTELYHRVEHVPVPTIAVCVGSCVGAGAEIVAGCDLRVAGDNLKLAWAGARLGVPVGPARLTQLVGLSRAKELAYTGRPVGAAEAASYGLANRVASADQAEATALELADLIARQSTDGVRVLKEMFRHLERTGRTDRVRERTTARLPAPRHRPAPRLTPLPELLQTLAHPGGVNRSHTDENRIRRTGPLAGHRTAEGLSSWRTSPVGNRACAPQRLQRHRLRPADPHVVRVLDPSIRARGPELVLDLLDRGHGRRRGATVKRRLYEDDHEAFRSSVREFVQRSVSPYVDEHAANKQVGPPDRRPGPTSAPR